MVVQTIRLSLAEERVYSDAASGRSLLERVDAQLADASEFLHTPLFPLLGVAAVAALAVFSLCQNASRTGWRWASSSRQRHS